MTCEEVLTRMDLEVTAEARERFAELQGSCMGVVDRDGELYMHTEMVVRRVSGKLNHSVPSGNRPHLPGTTRLQSEGADRQRPGPRSGHVPRSAVESVRSGQRHYPTGLSRRFAFETEDESALTVVPAAAVAALPTTG